ncbi:tyrosine-protein phosphatase [Plantactinospora sp. GCM10030261]|uniref:tyrosine-protein phosphatase n=1 Tax=Plantactinospora sp. GCM10030261 TaxID=3273420 RepID=UPI003614C57E
MPARRPALVGAPNARDLGGFTGYDGRRVRSGVLFRTPALGRLTDEDVAVLGGLGVACVLDLRGRPEIDAAPPDRLAGTPRMVHVPVHDPRHPVVTYVSAVLLGHDLDAYAALAAEGTPRAMGAIYRWFVADERVRAGFATAARLAVDPANLPLLFHCTAGKDRTGWLAAILLTILGVDRTAIEADYLRTNELTESLREVILAALRRRQPDLDEGAVRAVLEVRPEYLAAGYSEVDRVFGSFDAYLRRGLGLTDDELVAVRKNLLD